MDINNSWCNLSDELSELPKEKEILEGTSIVDSFGLGINKNLNSDDQIMSIGEILAIEYDELKLSEFELLKYQTYIASQLKKYIMSCIGSSNDIADILIHLPKFVWLLNTSAYLSKKRNLREVKSKKRDTYEIQRNSYEFCEYDYKCLYNKTGKCTKKHFVHNYVNSEISEIIRYLTNDKIQNKNMKEIYTSINTISYILNHMKEELENLDQCKQQIRTHIK
jgi:hypothetical protein